MLLKSTSNANRTSPVQRGKWILENLLGSPPPPPPNVPPPKENSANAVLRFPFVNGWRNTAPIPVCAGCHKIMDPIGLSLRKLRWRQATGVRRTPGIKIDSSGQLVDGTPVDGPSSLRKALLARPDAFVATMTEKLLMYGIGRETKYYDMPVVRAVMRDAARDRYRFSDLVLGIVKSAPFQMRMPEQETKQQEIEK